MIFDLAPFLPEGISWQIAAAFTLLSAFSSLITAMLSLGGGMLMLSALTFTFPAAVVVPVHGAIQLGSNAGRAVLQRRHIQWHLVLWISLGGVLGSLIGGGIASRLPDNVFKFVIGLFILYSVWAPSPHVSGRGPIASFLGGTIISALGMIVGVTGPLIANFVKFLPDRRQLVATHATLMSFQNAAKIFAFVLYGFAFHAYLPLILAMIFAGLVGTALGSRLLLKLPERAFRHGFRIVITIVALDLLRRAAFS